MGELQNILPNAIVAAALPSLALVAFFWKGDDALSVEFKEWLGQKLSGMKFSSRRADIEQLERVFDLVYSSRYLSLSSFVRVAIVSTIAAVITFVVSVIWTDGHMADYLRDLFLNRDLSFDPRKTGRLLSLLVVNNIFDYISVIKARLIMHKVVELDLRHKNILFLIIDAAGTILILNAFVFVERQLFEYLMPQTGLWFMAYLFLFYAFFGTTFLTFFLTMMYLLSIWSLIAVRLIPAVNGILWILPIRSLPIRSIGLMAGIVLFLALSVLNLVPIKTLGDLLARGMMSLVFI